MVNALGKINLCWGRAGQDGTKMEKMQRGSKETL